MEELSCMHTADCYVDNIIDQLVEQSYSLAQIRKLDTYMNEQMPKNYLNYINNVSILLHNHREPRSVRPNHNATLTQPTDYSNQISERGKFIFQNDQLRDSTLKISNFLAQRQSVYSNNSNKSLKNLQESPFHSKAMLQNKKKVLISPKLVPLQNNEFNLSNFQEESKVKERISQLRKRKVKLQEAMRIFKQQDRIDKIRPTKLSKSPLQQFTTDYKGKILNFNSKVKRMRNNKGGLVVRIQTRVENGRHWSKISSMPKRGIFKQNIDKAINWHESIPL